MFMSNYSVIVYAYCNKGYDPMDILRELNKVYFTVECQYCPDTSSAGLDFFIFTAPLKYHPINDDGGNEIHDLIEALNHVAGEGRYRMIIDEKHISSNVIFSNGIPTFLSLQGSENNGQDSNCSDFEKKGD